MMIFHSLARYLHRANGMPNRKNFFGTIFAVGKPYENVRKEKKIFVDIQDGVCIMTI
jgi:hypothetical protein